MGKTIDLPDPLDTAAPIPAPSADELLAQLAGDEIDRLLAEADAHPDPLPPPPTAVRPSLPAAVASSTPPVPNKLVDPATDPELAQELDSLFSQLHADTPIPTPTPTPAMTGRAGAAVMPVVPAAAPAPGHVSTPAPFDAPVAPAIPLEAPPVAIPADDPRLRDEIEALYNPLLDQPPVPPPAKPAAAAAAAPAAAERHVDAAFSDALASLDALDPTAQTTALERQVLASEDLMKAAIEAAMPVHNDRPEPASPAPEPAERRSLNPLVWLSSRFSDATLDALGKVAILTLINALAILLYVVIFRPH